MSTFSPGADGSFPVDTSGVTHPIITFRINLNSDLISILHPARYQTDQDKAATDAANFNLLKTSWLPGFLRCENIMHHNDGFEFTVRGQKATYLKNTYTVAQHDGTPPLLTVVNYTYASA